MEYTARPQATLVDVLDRVLDRSLVINADIIISLAGIPLIGINLRAALAGMETMVKYGVMEEWDRSIRGWEQRPIDTPRGLPIGHGEILVTKDTRDCWVSAVLDISGSERLG